MNHDIIKKASVALIIWNFADEKDVKVFMGKIINEGSDWIFLNESKKWRVQLDKEQMNRIRSVDDKLKSALLGADFAISMTLTDLPDASSEDHISTGINWSE